MAVEPNWKFTSFTKQQINNCAFHQHQAHVIIPTTIALNLHCHNSHYSHQDAIVLDHWRQWQPWRMWLLYAGCSLIITHAQHYVCVMANSNIFTVV